MRSQRMRRVCTGGAVLALAAALSPGGFAVPATARAATGSTAAPASARQAAADGDSFDPARAYVPGSPVAAQSAQSATAPPGMSASTAPGAANASGGSLGLGVSGSLETAQGTAMTDELPGGDSLEVYSQGLITLVRPDGSAVWQRSTGSLYHDWKLSFVAPGFTVTPQVAIGTDPADPFEVTTAEPYAMTDTHPYAVGDLTGDGDTDIAVAESLGVNLGASECNCGGAFNVPGSDLHVGTFVSVLDSRTGATLYSEVDPGFVSQLAIVGRNLIIGDETGDPSTPDGPGAWNSVSTLRALILHAGRNGLSATVAWQYSTKAQWGMLLGLQPVGDNVAVAWTDTPLGLGEPGPPDGHVVLIDAHGKIRWDQRTAGYPVLSQYDPSRGELAVVEETDPTQRLSYTLAGLRVADGRTVSAVTTTGMLPTTLTISALTSHSRPAWLVAGVVTQPSYVQPPYYSFTGAEISAVDPDGAKTLWTHTLADDGQNPPQPGAIEVVAGAHGQSSVVVDSWEGSTTPNPAQHLTEYNDLQGLAGNSGAQLWEQAGDVPDPLTLVAAGGTVRGITPEQDALSYRATDGTQVAAAPLLGMINTTIAADVTGTGRTDYIAGDESGAVYAIDAASLTAGDDAPRVLWRAEVGGPVDQIVPGTVDGRAVLAVAASSGIAVVDERTGRVLQRMALPGQYAWNVAIGQARGRTIVVTGTDRLSAFDAETGKALWTYQPTGASYFADASLLDGVVVTEYQSQVLLGQSPSAMAAIGIDAATGHTAWTSVPDPTTTASAQIRNGVVAGPGIPGAGVNGAAFTWVTPDGQGRVDIRDARTGALDYSNTSPDLVSHESYSLTPGGGLISTGEGGTASIAPTGATGADWLTGSDVAVATSGGTQVLLNARAGLNAYPMSAIDNGDNVVDPLADTPLYLAGKLYVTPADKVLATPINWFEHEIISTESGEWAFPYNVGIQQGLAVLSLAGTPAANATRHAAQQTQSPASRPKTLALADTAAAAAHIAVAQPAAQVEVRGYSSTGVPLLTESTPSGYDPATIQKYLGLHGTGAGQTVAVVDAYGNPNIVDDVNQFSSQFGLPQTCSGGATSGCFKLTVTPVDGAENATPDPDWGLETSMDVEWIHAVAPQAAVVLVEAPTGDFASLFHAVDVAAQLRPDAVSMSWGIGEEFTDETYYDHFCQLAESVCVVSSGDYGHPGSYPAYNPAVLAIGGTSLQLAADGSVTGETAWSGSGGGQSYVEPTPAYQKGVVSGGGRGIPDVSYDADPATGVAVYDSFSFQGQSGWFQVGGTSLGAPSWSAILAATNQLRAAAGASRLTAAGDTAQQAVYASAGQLGQIVSGSNGFCPTICTAGPGYNFVTGLGSARSGLDATLAAAR